MARVKKSERHHGQKKNGVVCQKKSGRCVREYKTAVTSWMTVESRIETYASREEWFKKVAEHPERKTAKNKRAQHIEKFKEDERKVQGG